MTGLAEDNPIGEVQEGGFVKFNLSYKAIVFRPFRNEVLDAIVTSIDHLGINCTATGACKIFIYKGEIAADYAEVYNKSYEKIRTITASESNRFNLI